MLAVELEVEEQRMKLPDGLCSEDSRIFLDAWDRWRGERLLPKRSDFRLADIKQLLPRLLLLEYRSAREVIFRLAGTMVRARLGTELTGKNYIELAEPAEREERAMLLRLEIAQPCGAAMVYPLAYPSGFVAPVEIVSVPVEPNHPGEPMLVLALFSELTQAIGEDPSPAGDKVAPGKGLTFFDIGAGVPTITRPPPAL